MNKTSILSLTLVAIFASGSAMAAPAVEQSGAVTQLARKGADDRQKDDRGGSRLGDDRQSDELAREGGVRGRGRGI